MFLSLQSLLGNTRNQGPAFVILFDDFNARHKNRWMHYIRRNECMEIESINSSCCIDVILTDQSNLVISIRVQPSLHENCHDFFTKFNLQIMYPPNYQRLVLYYKNANISSIQKALDMIYWNRLLSSANAEKHVNISNDTIFNIFSILLEGK